MEELITGMLKLPFWLYAMNVRNQRKVAQIWYDQETTKRHKGLKDTNGHKCVQKEEMEMYEIKSALDGIKSRLAITEEEGVVKIHLSKLPK